MKVYKTKTVQEQVLDKTICDYCNKEIEEETMWEVYDYEMRRTYGKDCYPESGQTETSTLDLCSACSGLAFDILKSSGFNVRIEVSNY